MIFISINGIESRLSFSVLYIPPGFLSGALGSHWGTQWGCVGVVLGLLAICHLDMGLH